MAANAEQPANLSPIEQAIQSFRSGQFDSAAKTARAALEHALQHSADRFTALAHSLVMDPRVQPLFFDNAHAVDATRFFSWMCKTVEQVLGDTHMIALFARVRLTSALAVSGQFADASTNLDATLNRIPTTPLSLSRTHASPHVTPPLPIRVERQPQATETPVERHLVCEHLAPVLIHARKHGAAIAAQFDSLESDRRLWVYLDGAILDTTALLQRFSLPICVVVHTELYTGPRPCHGFRCETHGDAILGLHPKQHLNARVLQ